MEPLESKDSKEKSVSVKIGDKDSYTMFKITKIENPKDYFLLTMGRVIESEPFGHGYDVFLSAQQIEDLERILRYGREL